MPTVAINGLGRIGRAALKILLDSDGLEDRQVGDEAKDEHDQPTMSTMLAPPAPPLRVGLAVLETSRTQHP